MCARARRLPPPAEVLADAAQISGGGFGIGLFQQSVGKMRKDRVPDLTFWPPGPPRNRCWPAHGTQYPLGDALLGHGGVHAGDAQTRAKRAAMRRSQALCRRNNSRSTPRVFMVFPSIPKFGNRSIDGTRSFYSLLRYCKCPRTISNTGSRTSLPWRSSSKASSRSTAGTSG